MWARIYWCTQGSAPLFGLCTSPISKRWSSMCMGEIAFMSLERWWSLTRIYFSAVLEMIFFFKWKECESSLKIYIDPG